VSDNVSAPAFISHLRLDQSTKKNCSTCAHNVIECIFGILKQRFMILTHPPKYTMRIQAHIPPALGAIHNFIRIHDPGEINDFTYEDNIDDGQAGGLALGPANVTERT
jgi:hypothetical protein